MLEPRVGTERGTDAGYVTREGEHRFGGGIQLGQMGSQQLRWRSQLQERVGRYGSAEIPVAHQKWATPPLTRVVEEVVLTVELEPRAASNTAAAPTNPILVPRHRHAVSVAPTPHLMCQ
ncbi:hypothetical protein [Ferrimicrobium sp.]|uniref:hypothetical protein n=1 Tax=Ferrimicrobium sp. TaxID=2926050 RepID=UPI0026092075|nr:hypothetical protein [Ferrimicrobium sp.]